MIEKLLIAIVLVACLVLLLRMALPARAQQRFDTTLRRWNWQLRGLGQRLWRWPKARKDAARTAEEVIRRAREGKRRGNGRGNGRDGAQDKGQDQADGEWDGNVYRPKSFKEPRKPH